MAAIIGARGCELTWYVKIQRGRVQVVDSRCRSRVWKTAGLLIRERQVHRAFFDLTLEKSSGGAVGSRVCLAPRQTVVADSMNYENDTVRAIP